MSSGWKCPNCGKAHAPHVQTCPEPSRLDVYGPPLPPVYPLPYGHDWTRPFWENPVIAIGTSRTSAGCEPGNFQSYN